MLLNSGKQSHNVSAPTSEAAENWKEVWWLISEKHVNVLQCFSVTKTKYGKCANIFLSFSFDCVFKRSPWGYAPDIS
jgi:hypothetical protein